MKLNREALRKMILQEMQQYGKPNPGVFSRPSRKDFVMAASGIGNVLQGMGMPGESYGISQYFLGLINADHQARNLHGAESGDDKYVSIMNSVPNPGDHGDKTYPRGNDIMNALRDLGLTYENPRYKKPGREPMQQMLESDLDAFSAEVAENISSRNRN